MELKVYFAAKNFKIHPCKGIFKKVIEKAMLWEKKKSHGCQNFVFVAK